MCTRILLLWLLLASACGEGANEDPRCQDPRIGSVLLDVPLVGSRYAPQSNGTEPASHGFCDGSPGIKLVAMHSLGRGAFADYLLLHAYGGAFFFIDGKCHYYAMSYGVPRITMGIVSSELLTQLTADLKLDQLAELPSSKDTRTPHFHDRLLATETHSLRCRDMLCRTPEATAVLDQAVQWIEKLAAQGQPATGPLTAFAFPELVLSSQPTDAGMTDPVLPWPLTPTLRSLPRLVVTDRLYPTRGLELSGEEAAMLRAVRMQAVEMDDSESKSEPSATFVSDCGQIYRLLLRDELPSGFALQRFLDEAWARPVIASCIPGFDMPEVTPCPSDFAD